MKGLICINFSLCFLYDETEFQFDFPNDVKVPKREGGERCVLIDDVIFESGKFD